LADGWDEIEVRNIGDDSVRINALRAGDVDFIVLVPESEIPRLQSEEKEQIETNILHEGTFWWFAFNHTRPPFDDPRVRKAAQLAHDARQLAEGTTLGQGLPYEQPWVQTSRWRYDQLDIPARDVARAKELLAEAGHANGLKARMLTSTSWYTSQGPASQILQAQLAEAGIQLEIENVETGTFFEKGFKLDFDMIDIGWDPEPWDPDDYYFNCFHPKGFAWALGGGNYPNQQVHTLLEQGRVEQDFQKRRATYQQVESLLQSDGAAIFSYRLTAGFAWRTNLKGFTTSARGDYAHASGGVFGMSRTG
jgi:ABC-type transport system substrate-binding protein